MDYIALEKNTLLKSKQNFGEKLGQSMMLSYSQTKGKKLGSEIKDKLFTNEDFGIEIYLIFYIEYEDKVKENI